MSTINLARFILIMTNKTSFVCFFLVCQNKVVQFAQKQILVSNILLVENKCVRPKTICHRLYQSYKYLSRKIFKSKKKLVQKIIRSKIIAVKNNVGQIFVDPQNNLDLKYLLNDNPTCCVQFLVQICQFNKCYNAALVQFCFHEYYSCQCIDCGVQWVGEWEISLTQLS